MASGSHIFFTAPWDPMVVRRGDALGLRAFTEVLADAVAPDLSNRIIDGRWVTILSWCLVRSQEIYHTSGGQSVLMRSNQNERYAWLRPLELMWVARTMDLVGNYQERTLAGQRSVRPWLENGSRRAHRFGLSEDQFRAYRQTGMYGGYRLAFRRWPNMTVRGDGWTPGPATIELAKWLEGKLRRARPSWRLYANDDEGELTKKSVNSGIGKEDEWWLRKWNNFKEGSRNVDFDTLPRPRNDYARLPESELLKPLIFGTDTIGQKRLSVIREIQRSTAQEHIEICEHLGSVFAKDQVIALLPHFSRLADSGMEAMDFVANALREEGQISLTNLTKKRGAKTVCKRLVNAAQRWNTSIRPLLHHIKSANDFALKVQREDPRDCLSALLTYHEECGGGLRWFVLRDGKIEPRTPLRTGSSRYRFRLWPLARLAKQCGVLRNMPLALRRDYEVKEDEFVEDANE